jgi:Cdc6-like AAA superfamily ATPase
MISKPKFQNLYVGPRAIFDPNYIPPQLLFRKRELKSLNSILTDSLYDEFSLNILYQGITGIGKKSIVNKVLEDLSVENKNSTPFQTISIDCKEKTPEELIISLLAEMIKESNLNFNLNSLLNSRISYLWNAFKLASRRLTQDSYLLIIFNNIEYLEPETFRKFLHLGKELNISIISTINNVLRTSTLDIISEFDQKKKLEFFTYNELFSILKQRASLTFLHEVDKELIELITDLIFEYYVPVPGKGIDIFRDIYPSLKDQRFIKHYELLELSQNHFDTSGSIDEFSMLTYLSEEDLLTIIFLDNLTNHFINKSNYYITSKELKELYDVSIESLEYEKDSTEFKKLIEMLEKIGILSPSKKSIIDQQYISNEPLNCIYFFMITNPNQLKAIIDTVFGYH